MYYPDEVIEEVRSRNDIVDVVSAYVKLKRSGGNLFGLCPFHSEKSPSFSVSPSKQIYYCFGCGAGGNVISFVMQYENCSFQEAVQTLADRAGISLPEEEQDGAARQEHSLRSQILEVNKMAAAFYYYQLRSKSGQPGMDYLKGRELSDETIHGFGLGYAGKYSDSLYQYLRSKGIGDQLLRETGLMVFDERKGMLDKFWNRVMFPIMDVNSKVIGFGGRVMGDGKPKYLNSPETRVFDKSRNLYGLNFARRSRKKVMIVCEGYMDVISMHQAGFVNSVASLGTALTSQHASLLKRYTDEVVLSYDSDGAGIRAALRAIPLLKEAGLRSKVLDLSPFKDPDEFIKAKGNEAFQERIDQAQGSFFFELKVVESRYNMADPESKTAFFREIARRIAGFEQEVERENYIEAVAQKYHVSFDGLRRMVGTELMKGIRTAPGVSGSADLPSSESSSFSPGSAHKRGSNADEGLHRSQCMLLTWLTEYPQIYPVLREYVAVEDYSEGFCREAAAMLYEQLENGEPVPARIISHFTEAEDQKKAAALFNTSEPGLAGEELKKAMRETIRKVMESGQKNAGTDTGMDMAALKRMIERKKKLENLGRLEIPL